MRGNPYGNWEMRAARVPDTDESLPCVESCKRRDEACFQRLQGPGANGNAQEMEVCYEDMYQCYAACPGATEVLEKYNDIQLSEAMSRACKAQLAEDERVYCMTRNGIVGQAFDPK